MRRDVCHFDEMQLLIATQAPLDRCCQTNANQSLFVQTHSTLACTELTPLGESGGAFGLESLSVGEAALECPHGVVEFEC